MSKSTKRGKSNLRSKTKPDKNKKVEKKKPEIEGLAEAEQPLLYYGPPPAIKQLYKKQEYDKDFHPHDMLKHMQEGSSRSLICASWGITYGTFNEWLETKPEMAAAYSIGKPAFDAYYKQALRHAAFGQMKTVRENSLFFMLKNQAGFGESGGEHEFEDGMGSEVVFVDDRE